MIAIRAARLARQRLRPDGARCEPTCQNRAISAAQYSYANTADWIFRTSVYAETMRNKKEHAESCAAWSSMLTETFLHTARRTFPIIDRVRYIHSFNSSLVLAPTLTDCRACIVKAELCLHCCDQIGLAACSAIDHAQLGIC